MILNATDQRRGRNEICILGCEKGIITSEDDSEW